MDVRIYKSNKSMTPEARQAHVRNLANIRQKKRYRKVKMERFKKNTLTTQKVSLDVNTRTADILMNNTYTDSDDETDTDSDIDDDDDEEVLVYLMDDLNGVDDTATLELIDLIENKLGITDKLNAGYSIATVKATVKKATVKPKVKTAKPKPKPNNFFVNTMVFFILKYKSILPVINSATYEYMLQLK